MNRAEYLKDSDVGDFLNWAERFVTGDCLLDPRPNSHGNQLGTLYDAFEGYRWKFSFTHDGETSKGVCYEDTAHALSLLRRRLSESERRGDTGGFRRAATAVLHWGRVGGHNEKYLDRLGDEALPRLTSNARLLNPAKADLDRLSVVDPMNSGFSKIYSLLADGLPIYDSRVACALASLVRWFGDCTLDAPYAGG